MSERRVWGTEKRLELVLCRWQKFHSILNAGVGETLKGQGTLGVSPGTFSTEIFTQPVPLQTTLIQSSKGKSLCYLNTLCALFSSNRKLT